MHAGAQRFHQRFLCSESMGSFPYSVVASRPTSCPTASRMVLLSSANGEDTTTVGKDGK